MAYTQYHMICVQNICNFNWILLFYVDVNKNRKKPLQEIYL
jgi:hypothetical protein